MMKILSGLALLITLVALSGCGSDESQAKARFVDRGDAICRKAMTEQARLVSHLKVKVLPENFETVEAVFLPPMKEELRRLQALHPPPGEGDQVRAILRAIESGLEDARVDGLDLFLRQTDPFARANALARKFGFVACAESSHAVLKPRG